MRLGVVEFGGSECGFTTHKARTAQGWRLPQSHLALAVLLPKRFTTKTERESQGLNLDPDGGSASVPYLDQTLIET